MKNTVTLKSSQAGENNFVLATRRLWPFGFILATVVGIAIAFAVAFGR
jgi:hypothetical protein